MLMDSIRFWSTNSKRRQNRRAIPAVAIIEHLEDRALLAGVLDAGFETDGMVVAEMGTAGESAHQVIVQSDQKIVVVGNSHEEGFLVIRYNPDGSFDSTFGTGGKVVTSFGNPRELATSVAQQADGKLVVAGWTGESGHGKMDFGLVRYNSDGSLNSSFGMNGQVTTALGTSSDLVSALVIQSDGNIVAVGSTRQTVDLRDLDIALVRYNSDGSLDSTFLMGGKVVTTFGSSTAEAAVAVVLTSDQKIVVAGWSQPDIENYGSSGSVVADQTCVAFGRRFSKASQRCVMPALIDPCVSRSVCAVRS